MFRACGIVNERLFIRLNGQKGHTILPPSNEDLRDTLVSICNTGLNFYSSCVAYNCLIEKQVRQPTFCTSVLFECNSRHRVLKTCHFLAGHFISAEREKRRHHLMCRRGKVSDISNLECVSRIHG